MSSVGKYGEPWRQGTEADNFGHGCILQGAAPLGTAGTRVILTGNSNFPGEMPELIERAIACVNACDGLEDPEKEIADLRAQNTSLFRLLADIRAAAGDPSGRLMQDELVEHIGKLKEAALIRHNIPGDPADSGE